MSGNLCAYPVCTREVFEGGKCIFHCEKDDWYVDEGYWQDWTKSANKVNFFWAKFALSPASNFSGFIFPEFRPNVIEKIFKINADTLQKKTKRRTFSVMLFNRTRFLAIADFSGVTSAHIIAFAGATFTKQVNFSKAAFTSPVDFEGATFSQGADFSDTTFEQSVTWQDAQLKGDTLFSNTKFAQAPNMHGADLYSNTDFTNITCGIDLPNRSHGRYRLLKKISEDSGDYRAASIFYAAEQHCLLETGGLPFVEAAISWCYKSVSYYGSRIFLPVLWLAALQLLFPFLFLNAEPSSALPLYAIVSLSIAYLMVSALWLTKKVGPSRLMDIGAGLLLAVAAMLVAFSLKEFSWGNYWDRSLMLLRNLFRPFYGWEHEARPGIHYLFGLMHLTTMYSAFAMFIFAIRRRFKME